MNSNNMDNIASGVLCGSGREAAEWVRKGATFIGIGNEALCLANALRKEADDFRSISPGIPTTPIT